MEEALHLAHGGQHMYLLCFGSFDVDFIFLCFITDFNYGLAAYKNRETIQNILTKSVWRHFAFSISYFLFLAIYFLHVEITDGV